MNLLLMTNEFLSGPEKYIGPIGKLLDGELWKLPVADFTPIPAKDFPIISEDIFKTFSADVKYLYLICISVKTGKLSENFVFVFRSLYYEVLRILLLLSLF